jgi:hypothetical protein
MVVAGNVRPNGAATDAGTLISRATFSPDWCRTTGDSMIQGQLFLIEGTRRDRGRGS